MTAKTARIIRFHELGGPEALKIEQCKVPAVPKGHVRIRVKAIGLNRADVMFRRGTYIEKASLPSKLGYEAAGFIDKLGEDITPQTASTMSVGDAVSIIPPIGLSQYGTYGDYAVVPAEYIVPKPDNITFEEAAASWMQYITAYGGIIEAGKLQEGEIALITAASSSVGLAAIEITKATGAIPIATTLNQQIKDEVLKHGAPHVIAIDRQDLDDSLKSIMQSLNHADLSARSKEHQLAVAFDAVSGSQVETIAANMAKKGIIVSHGRLDPSPTIFPLQYAIRNSLSMRGFVFTEIVGDKKKRNEATKFILNGLQQGLLKPVISATYPIEDIVKSHQHLESSQQIGKIVITISD